MEQLGGDEALFVNDYVSFYPSANLSYTVDDRNQWVLSYNRRVNRPRGRQVNPFVDNADPRNLRYGNPFLRPEYTDGLEFGHQLTTKAVTLTTSLFYKTTRDVIRRYIEVAETGVAYRTFVNLARQSNSGLEVVAMWRKGRTLQVRLNGSVYYQSTDGSNLAPDLGNNGFQGNAGYQVSALVKGAGRFSSTDATAPRPNTHRARLPATCRTVRLSTAISTTASSGPPSGSATSLTSANGRTLLKAATSSKTAPSSASPGSSTPP